MTFSQPTPSSHRPDLVNLLLIILVILLTLAVTTFAVINTNPNIAKIFFSKANPKKNLPSLPTPNHIITPSPSPTPRPTLVPIPSGIQTIQISSGKKTGPSFGTVIIDPCDPSLGSNQLITLNASSIQPITKLTATLITDDQQKTTLPFKLASGNARSGKWEVTFNYHHSYDYVYKIVFTATDSNDVTNQFDLILR